MHHFHHRLHHSAIPLSNLVSCLCQKMHSKLEQRCFSTQAAEFDFDLQTRPSEGPNTSSLWIWRKSVLRFPRYRPKPRFLSLLTLIFDLWPWHSNSFVRLRARNQTRPPGEFGANPFSGSGDISSTDKKVSAKNRTFRSSLRAVIPGHMQWNVVLFVTYRKRDNILSRVDRVPYAICGEILGL